MSDYKDPLHVPSADLVVWHNGKEHMMLNKALLDQQNCWENLDWLKELHESRLVLEDEIADTVEQRAAGGNDERTVALLKLSMELYLEEWTSIQFLLQEAWGFPEDVRFHRFWDMKGCKCPKMDNNDSYPSGFYITGGDCRVHGGNQ